jgi:hypothetical protein
MNVYECTLVIADGIAETQAVGAAIELQVERVIGTQTVGGSGITDGDKGDITVSGSGTVWTVDARAITAPKLFEVGASKLLGRHTGTAGDVQEISVDGGLEFHGGQLRRAALTGPVTASAGGNATTLAQNGAATGNYYKWDGTNWVPAPISYLEDIEDIPSTFTPAAHTHTLSNLTQSGATTNQVAQWNGTAWVPATVSSGGGKLLAWWLASTTTAVAGTTLIPLDDTIPQITEGMELINVSVTPTNTSSKLKVTVRFWHTCSGAHYASCALFVGSGPSAVATSFVSQNATSIPALCTVVFVIDSFSGTQTISFRAGTDRNTVTFRMLSVGGSGYYSTTDPAVILVEELGP